MASLINQNRPPVFCPGCSHDRVVRALDNAFQNMGLRGDQVVMISDIGCSGLIDTFFNTHALHGLHGRALTYAAGIKLAHPDLNVVVTMGDGGLGIGGAHFLEACRRNLNLTLLILNNFNFGMTGGQFSATTPTRKQHHSSLSLFFRRLYSLKRSNFLIVFSYVMCLISLSSIPSTISLFSWKRFRFSAGSSARSYNSTLDGSVAYLINFHLP